MRNNKAHLFPTAAGIGDVRFTSEDCDSELPPPGYYRSTIASARFARSAQGNVMLQVVHTLEWVGEDHKRVPDYFVLHGVSSHGLAVARRRLVELYRACGLNPKAGDEVLPAHLVDAQLQVRVVHEPYNGQLRLKVVGYRKLDEGELTVPF
jgi:hypothetical protein